MSDHNVRARINLAPTALLILASIIAFLFWPVEALFPSTRGFVAYTFFGTPQERQKYMPVVIVLFGFMGVVFGLAALLTIVSASRHPIIRNSRIVNDCDCGNICSPNGFRCELEECQTGRNK